MQGGNFLHTPKNPQRNQFSSIAILVKCKAERFKILGRGSSSIQKSQLASLGPGCWCVFHCTMTDSAQFQLLTLFDFFVCLYFTAPQTTTLLIYGLHWLADNNLDHSQFLFSGSVLVPSSNFVSTTCWIFSMKFVAIDTVLLNPSAS